MKGSFILFFLLALVYAAPPPSNLQPNIRENYRMGIQTQPTDDNQRFEINQDKSASLAVSETGQNASQSSNIATGIIVALVGAGVAGIAFSIYRFKKSKETKNEQQPQV